MAAVENGLVVGSEQEGEENRLVAAMENGLVAMVVVGSEQEGEENRLVAVVENGLVVVVMLWEEMVLV